MRWRAQRGDGQPGRFRTSDTPARRYSEAAETRHPAVRPAPRHSSGAGVLLVCLIHARCALLCRRRRLDAAVGRVAIRRTGGSAARSINWISVSSAARRFLSWVRNRRAVISTSPCWVVRRPAIVRNRSCMSCGSPDAVGSNRNCTAVATLLTFCPPGPDACTNVSTMALSSIVRDGVIEITPSRQSPRQARLRRPGARFGRRPDLRPSPISFARAERVCA